MASVCRARLLSDLSGQTACDKVATSADGRLCTFHSRQCQALYRGYKKRNAELDSMPSNQPSYFAGKKGSIVSHDYADINDEDTLKQLHDYLFRTFQLLDRVIRARKLHHSHFFAIDNDYGHQKYLDKLLNERQNITRALEKLGKRTVAVMYEKQQWFDWVKETQAKEEKEGETESRKVKLESLLFQRHQKEIKRQQLEMQARESQQQQERFLDETYQQRLSDMSEEEQDDWDPIRDVYGYERENYVELIKYFLMLKDQEPNIASEDTSGGTDGPQAEGASESASPAKALSKSAKKRAKKVNAETKKLADPTLKTPEGRGANVIEMETRGQMRERLRKPVKFERATGWYVQGSGPTGYDAQTPTIPDDEIEQLLDEVAEIKSFLFCRLLLTQSTLLPAALKAESIEEFVSKEEVSRESLRDLCLKLERPVLQDVRDACADFIRERDGVEDLEDADENEEIEDDRDVYKTPDKYRLKFKKSKVPENYKTKREKSAKKANKNQKSPFTGESGAVDFGKVTDESQYTRTRTRIKICGRYMYNYPSEKALTRGGWFHFSIIAKDSDLFDAVELCRNWNEFFELNILCLYHYFPAPKWTKFIGDLARQQLLQLGFIPYFHADKAESVTNYFQTGSRGMTRRAHQHTEMRNFICGQVKRDDPVSRRFIQYLAMESWELRALVRDGKTGRILISPPEDELWLLREKSGWGRASRNEYDIVGEVGPTFFEAMDRSRKWHIGFEEFYDVYIWDSSPGRSFLILQRKIEEVLTRAMRVRELKDMFSTAGPILKTLTKDPVTERVRSIKPDEKAESIWDGLETNARAWSWSPQGGFGKEGFIDSYKYTEADELEDVILFPLENTGLLPNDLYRHVPSAMEMFETDPIDFRRFAGDLDTEDEVESSDGTDLGEAEDDDDSDWEDKSDHDGLELVHKSELKPEESEDAAEAVEILAEQFRSTISKGEDYFVSILRDPESKRARKLPKSIRTDPVELMGCCRFALRCLQEYDHSDRGMEADFYRHIDRQKSKVFKQSFHLGDAEPSALKRYVEHKYMVDAMDAYVMENGTLNPEPFELCKTMRMSHLFREERRISDDAFTAYAAIAVFYSGAAFLASPHGEPWRDTALLDQAARALHPPDRRTHRSNKTMPKAFWKDWEALLSDKGRAPGDAIDDIYPLSWRKALRPIIAKLFKAGVICASYGGSAAGVATAAAEPGRVLDMYIDYRRGLPLTRLTSSLDDPTSITPSSITAAISSFAAQHPAARFSLLRLWSAPHFYPLMMGVDKRPLCAFLDDRGRCWEWKFVPKDMPYSEWSVHQQLSQRLQPYEYVWGKQVWVARDLVVVMGRDEGECRRFSEGATWAVQTKPWRLEVDFWRSFVGVDREFVVGLDERWLS